MSKQRVLSRLSGTLNRPGSVSEARLPRQAQLANRHERRTNWPVTQARKNSDSNPEVSCRLLDAKPTDDVHVEVLVRQTRAQSSGQDRGDEQQTVEIDPRAGPARHRQRGVASK